MIIRRFTFTLLTLSIFVSALYWQGMLFHDKTVSRETPTNGEFGILRVGVSSDGMIALSEIAPPPSVATSQKVANHSRTIRAYVATNANEQIALYLEPAISGKHYLVSGGFLLAKEDMSLFWINDHTLQFYAKNADGILVRGLFDITAIAAIFEAVDLETRATLIHYRDTVQIPE